MTSMTQYVRIALLNALHLLQHLENRTRRGLYLLYELERRTHLGPYGGK